jgi:hypothetical protein
MCVKREFSFGGDLGGLRARRFLEGDGVEDVCEKRVQFWWRSWGLRARRFLEDDGLKDVCDKRVEFLGGGLGA